MKTISFLLLSLVATLSLAGDLKDASSQYIENRNYESLEQLSNAIKTGMSKAEVEELLGEADYSPTEGIFYYSSDRYIEHAKRPRTNIGLVVTYNTKSKQSLQVLKTHKLGPIGE